jgi:hypothetical protein
MRLTTPSFKNVEGEKKITLPNLMSVGRAVGGVALGAGMAANLIDPVTATVAAASLAATDAEGSVIIATRSFPRLQNALRIVPSSWGRVLDPIADKAYAISIFIGGMANGAIPLEQGIPVMATEVATMGATQLATHRRGGEVPEVGQVNKIGMVARMDMIANDLGAQATHGGVHDALAISGKFGFGAAFILGAASCINILRQGNEGNSEPVQ